MKKYKVLSFCLSLIILFSSFSSVVYANDTNTNKVNDVKITEIEKITKFEYEKVEDGQTYNYEETLSNNIVHTKKYKNNVIVNEFETQIIVDDFNRVSAKIIDSNNNSTKTIKISQDMQIESNLISPFAVVPPGRRTHPTDNRYYFGTSITGHMRFEMLTYAVIYAVISATVMKGKLIGKSVIGAAIGVIIHNEYRNVFYQLDTYYPYGSGMKGEPIWKKIQKLYAGNNRNVLIETLDWGAPLVVVN